MKRAHATLMPVAALLFAGALAACEDAGTPPRLDVPAAPALVETEPVNSEGDAADDPATWIDAADPTQSRVIGTQKKGGLYVYDLSGKILQFLPAGKLNNVDLRKDFPFAPGPAPIVAASDRDDQSIAIFRFDIATRQLDPVQVTAIPTGFDEVYGICLYRSPAGAYFAIATSKGGRVKQWRLTAQAEGGVAPEVVREFALGSIAEGCVADDALGHLYLAQEDVGIWKLAADPAQGDDRKLVDAVGAGRLTADVEGLALYARPDGTGYLVASSQGDSTFVVYDRGGANAYVGTFRVSESADGKADAVTGADGLDIVAAPLGGPWGEGILVVQDDENTAPAAMQNFKLVPWSAVETALGIAKP